MELYIVIYILLLSSCFFEKFALSTKKIVLFFWMVVFTLLGGLRWKTGGDWHQYYTYFQDVSWTLEDIFHYRRPGADRAILEPGFVLVNLVIKSLFNEFWIYNIITGAFVQYTYCKFCLHFSPKLPIMMYVLIIGMGMNSFMFVRSGLSVAVCYWAYIYIKERRLFPFVLVVVAGGLIHRQVLSLLPLYWIGKVNIKWWVYIIAYLCCMIFYAIFKEHITNMIMSINMDGDAASRLQMYTDEKTGQFGIKALVFRWVMYLGILCVFLYVRYIYKMERDFWYNTLLAGYFVVIFSVTIFTEGMTTLARFTAAYKPSRTILIMVSFTLLTKYRNKLTNNIVAYSLYWGLCSFNIYKELTSPMSRLCFIPYKSIFDFNLI